MSLQSQLSSMQTMLANIEKTLTEIKADLKEGDAVMDKHNVRIDRLEQSEKTRSKVFWTIGTAWIGLAVAWLWDRLGR